ncbi:N-acetylmuramoyl-L-alanine amidase family protein [Anaerofustis stercorihominis]|uniref:N-acetylmuramoyl-L-alanine amidase n=1 Tax=Anaerofustis stercorihominis TaxID=214853 RepID=A0A3E3DVH8_9FIRM|nr:N-acetylmuramoyl-L-alanine amidase [Anaerofustis stercorihominis]RGD73096.1 N-acetylmuramoyl-L-alanine amidase [Anaerofustis stercorihominis]
MKRYKKKKKFFIIITSILVILLLINFSPKSRYTILLDPGHGGKLSADKGATGVDKEKTFEYTLNDSVTLKLAEALKKEGYKVKFIREPGKDEKEVSLTKRTKITNRIKPDLFISIHHDSTGTVNNKSGYTIYYSSYKANLDNQDIYIEENGHKYPFIKEVMENGITTVYYLDAAKIKTSKGRSSVIVKDKSPCEVAKKSIKFANILNDQMNKLDYITPLVGSKRNAVKDNNFRVLRMANYPGVLIECGFLSNKNEVEQIKNEENQDKLVNKIVKSVNKYF